MPRVFDNIKELEGFLGIIVREAVDDALDDTGALERRRQKYTAAQTSEQDDDSPKKHVEEVEDETEEVEATEKSAPSADVGKPSNAEVVDAAKGDIFKMLNLMRSGKSIKDPKVKKALTTYIDQLTSAEQQSLYVFLGGLADMMVDGEPGTLAMDPGMAGIKMEPTEKAGEETEKVDVDVKSVKVTDEKEKENMPIVVGEAADKSMIRRRIKELWK